MNKLYSGKKIYFEAGAHDGHFQSRTYQFKDDANYFGILVEPSPDTYHACCHNRKNSNTLIYNCALVSNTYNTDTVKLYSSSISSAMNMIQESNLDHKDYAHFSTEGINVPARTIQSILDENSILEIDYMYLDVEGAEINALLGIDFSKTKINFLEVETHMWVKKEITYQEEIKMFEEMLKEYMVLQDIDCTCGHPKGIFVHKNI
jgi:FkbM family methyltransferase